MAQQQKTTGADALAVQVLAVHSALFNSVLDWVTAIYP